MKPPPSLQGRIVLRLSATILAATLSAYGWLWWEFESTTGNLRDKSLIESAHTIAKAIKYEPSGRIALNLPDTLLSAYSRSNGVHGFAIKDRSSGATLFATGAEVGPIPAKLDDDEDGSLYQYNPDGPGPATYFGDVLAFAVEQNQLVVQVVRLGSDYQELVETISTDFFEDGAWWAGPFLLALILVNILTVRGTLAPLRALSRQAEGIGPDTTDLRLPSTDVPQEVMPLVLAVNNALERLEAGLRLQRDFTADAAHELRTPLAVLTAHVDTLPDGALATALRRDLAPMTRLVEQLLRVAQAEALVVPAHGYADLAAIARDVAAYLAPMAILADRMIEVDAPDKTVLVHGHPDALFHAVRNLADNALRHTPAGTTATLVVTENPPSLMVRDHGPGVPTDMREVVFQRFWRSDRRDEGTGLGLAIVQRTMQAHGGEVVIEDVDGGGAQFRMKFPTQ